MKEEKKLGTPRAHARPGAPLPAMHSVSNQTTPNIPKTARAMELWWIRAARQARSLDSALAGLAQGRLRPGLRLRHLLALIVVALFPVHSLRSSFAS